MAETTFKVRLNSGDWGQIKLKRLLIILISILAFSLTGCIKKYPLTETDTNVVAEYMAGLLLKYDKNYSASLPGYHELDETTDTGSIEYDEADTVKLSDDDKDESSKDRIDKASNSETVEYVLSEVMNVPDFDIQYVGYRFADTLPEDKTNRVFSIDAKEGYQFLVVDFSVENKTDTDRIFNLDNPNITYQLDIDKGAPYKPQTVLLENNLIFIKNINIKAGEKTSAILAFEVPKDKDMKEIVLNISGNEKTKSIKIK